MSNKDQSSLYKDIWYGKFSLHEGVDVPPSNNKQGMNSLASIYPVE